MLGKSDDAVNCRTLRAMESFSVVRRLESTVRSLSTLDFSSFSSTICWLISSRFSRRSSMPEVFGPREGRHELDYVIRRAHRRAQRLNVRAHRRMTETRQPPR
jgi:hypothetical protein